MVITYHAAKRFVERVLKKQRYTHCDVDRAKELLQKLFSSVVTHKRYIPLPTVKGYIAVVKENIVVTILEKNSRWRRKVKLAHIAYR